jgi:hypothetical protein
MSRRRSNRDPEKNEASPHYPAYHSATPATAGTSRTFGEAALPGGRCWNRFVRAPLIERQTVEQMMASPRDRSSAQDAPRHRQVKRALS